MIRFIDLTTGKVFNGDVVYKDNGTLDTSSSYVHWFDKAQSTGKTYVQNVCIISDKRRLDIHIDIKKDEILNIGKINSNNTVFKLLNVDKINTNNTTYMNGIPYQDIKNLYTTDYTSYGGAYTSNYYVHMIYFAAESPTAFEAKEVFNITEYKEIVTKKTIIDPYTSEEREVEVSTFEPLLTYDYIIGADFYDAREEMKIGVANFGVELPESIQKAIYPSNVHDDAIDNILMNRKYKELLMNYIDIIGNKGSYASLTNALNWFEYPDILKIKEFWKHDEWDRTIYNDQEFTQQLIRTTREALVNYTKTTYMGIYCALQQVVKNDNQIVYEREIYPMSSWKHNVTQQLLNASLDKRLEDNGDGSGNVRQQLQIGIGEVYINSFSKSLVDENNRIMIDKDNYVIIANDNDSVELVQDHLAIPEGANFKLLDSMYKNMERFIGEPVPELEMAVLQWSKLDMSIKMALLGNFFESYFMPVHLDLIHSTIEDIVYTNAMKLISGGQMSRTDDIIHNAQVKCNIKDGQVFMLGDVNAQANSNTPYVREYMGPSVYYGKNRFEFAQNTTQIGDDRGFIINGLEFIVKEGEIFWKQSPIQIANNTVLYDDIQIKPIEDGLDVKINDTLPLKIKNSTILFDDKPILISDSNTLIYDSKQVDSNTHIIVSQPGNDNFTPIEFDLLSDGIYYKGKKIEIVDDIVTYDSNIVYPDKDNVITVRSIKFLYDSDSNSILLNGYPIQISKDNIIVGEPLKVEYEGEYVISDEIQPFKISVSPTGDHYIKYGDKTIVIQDGELIYNGAKVKYVNGVLILDNKSTPDDKNLELKFEDGLVKWDDHNITIISGHSSALPGYTGDSYYAHPIIGVEEGFVEIPSKYVYNLYDETLQDSEKEKLFDQEVKTILLNSYNGVGVVVPIQFNIPLNYGDVITKEILSLENDATKKWETTVFNNIYAALPTKDGYEVVINFNLLCTRDREYDLRLQFFCNSGQTYVKRVKFVTVDTRRALLDIYKVKSIRPAVSREANNYMFTHIYRSAAEATGKPIFDKDPLYVQNNPNKLHSEVDELHLYYTQYIPINGSSEYNPDGVKLKRMIVMRSTWYNDKGDLCRIEDILGKDSVSSLHPSNNIDHNYKVGSTDKNNQIIGNKPITMTAAVNNEAALKEWEWCTTQASISWAWLQKSFNVYKRNVSSSYRERDGENGSQEYLIFISKKFTTSCEDSYIKYIKEFAFKYGCNNLVLRDDLVYLPQDHYLEKLDRRTLAGLSVMPYETIAVIPNIKYLRYIDSYEWVFTNASTLKTYKLPSIKEPFVASNDPDAPYLEPGYYDITFRYKLSSETSNINEVCLKSAFIILPEDDDKSALYQQTKQRTTPTTTGTLDLIFKRDLYGKGETINRSYIEPSVQKNIMENAIEDWTSIPILKK